MKVCVFVGSAQGSTRDIVDVDLTAVVQQSKEEGLSDSRVNEYLSIVRDNPNTSLLGRRNIAQQFTKKAIRFNWDIPRTREGFYHYRAGLPAATKRAITFGPYADLLWLETANPSVDTAARFARDIRNAYPGKKLVYNLSPSFNWMGQGFSREALKSFVWDLAPHGLVGWLRSLKGLEANVNATASFCNSCLSQAFTRPLLQPMNCPSLLRLMACSPMLTSSKRRRKNWTVMCSDINSGVVQAMLMAC